MLLRVNNFSNLVQIWMKKILFQLKILILLQKTLIVNQKELIFEQNLVFKRILKTIN